MDRGRRRALDDPPRHRFHLFSMISHTIINYKYKNKEIKSKGGSRTFGVRARAKKAGPGLWDHRIVQCEMLSAALIES